MAETAGDEAMARKMQQDEAAVAKGEDEGAESIDLSAIGLGSATKPKHAGEGAWRLVKSVGVGVLGGAATLVAAPAIGAREGGAEGFAATPDAVDAMQKDKEWDERTGTWIIYDLAA